MTIQLSSRLHAVWRTLSLVGLGVLAAVLLWQMPATLAQSDACAAANTIDQTLPAGARWDMCWEHRDQAGIVLRDVYYTTPAGTRRKVLKEAALAQIHVPYDDGGAQVHHVTDPGLGGTQMAALTAEDCVGGTLRRHAGRNVLCQQVAARGYAYKYFSRQRQGDSLTLYSVSHSGAQTYIVQWSFADNGTIEPAIGNTGQLARRGDDATVGWPLNGAESNDIGIGYVNNYYWRLDFDIGENGNDDIVEEFVVNPAVHNTRRELTVTRLVTEAARTVNPEVKRSWRVRADTILNADGHAISYHLEPLHAAHDYVGPATEPWTQHDFYVTAHDPCEQFISRNPQTDGCGADVTQFVNGESLEGADVVFWYGITRHHLPRSEDEPFMNVRWDGFQIFPRDWTAQNPL